MYGKFRLTAILITALVPACLSAQATKPVISAIANVASYSPGPIAPGEMVVLFGSGLGPSQLSNLQLDAQGRVASTLSDVQVLFDGNPAPLIYVSATQVAAMVPYGVEGQVASQVQAVYQGVMSDPMSKSVAATAPAIFSSDSSGRGQGLISNLDGSRNSAANPVTPGSYISFYITGYGQTDPPGADGAVATGIASVKAPVLATIAGRTVQVLYAGSTPGFVSGFAQVNVQVPADLPYGGDLPLVVQVGDAFSQSQITVAVAGTPAPLPVAPVGVTATAIPPNQIRIAWTAADALATRFHVERQTGNSGQFAEVAVVEAAVLTFTDLDVTLGTTYQYRVRAENAYGYSTYSAVASTAIVVAQVAPPSNLQAIAVSQTLVSLTWNAANTNAQNFQIERKIGPTGSFTSLATVPNTATAYQDSTVIPSTLYAYRMRSQALSGFSGYSNESNVTTPAVPLPTPPNLTAAAISASQIRLSWSSTATGVVRFRIERRTSAGQYSEINQPGPSATSFDDSGLSASTTYQYRMRVETGAGLSAYSNEVTPTTMQGIPLAPSNLRSIATSTTQVSLTWTNNASDATAIRVESRTAATSTFSDIGAATTLTSTSIINNQPNTTYTFRVRAQNGAGYSAYSNETTVTTLPVPKTVFLIHGLGQGSADMQGLYGSLVGSSGIDLTRFRVDAGFDFSECANVNFCSSNCSVSAGAQKLAQYIANANPPGDIVLVGFSMGGLIARDLMANNRINLNGRKIGALITLGTPNLGYPYTLIDTAVSCTPLVQQMDGNWRSQQANNNVILSSFLLSLTNQWPSKAYPGSSGLWLAASGRSCSNPVRTINSTTGCRDRNPFSDGVVCDDSATYSINTASGTSPNRYWQDPGQIYVHSNNGFGSSLILCGNDGLKPTMSNPPSFGPLFATIKGLINGL
jgi:uncharacterized protein (TIGR03437 family)